MPSPIFSHPDLPEALSYKGVTFPLLVEPPRSEGSLRTDVSSVKEYLQTNREHIFKLLKRHSVLHFRGFASSSSTAEDFADYVTCGLGLSSFPYALGNAVRKSIVGNVVFTANEAPPEREIPFHHELAQTPQYPKYILFYCSMVAETGGETPICFSPAIYNLLAERFPSFMETIETHGVIYSRTMTRLDRCESAIGRGWAATFGAGSRVEVEAALRKRGYSWKWRGDEDDETLTEISPVLPAVLETNGRKAFFNQIFAAWFGWRDEFNSPTDCIRAGNGEKLDPVAMDGLKDILEANEVAVPWQRGDFVFIDNMQAMHSRRTFSGKRVVLASLAK